MSRRRIAEIAPVSAAAAFSPVDIGRTTSITSDPDGRLVATRQSAITAGLERRYIDPEKQEADAASKRFSGESERIGTWVCNKNTPFGERFGFL